MMVHDPTITASAAANPSRMRIGDNNSVNPSQREPGTFRIT